MYVTSMQREHNVLGLLDTSFYCRAVVQFLFCFTWFLIIIFFKATSCASKHLLSVCPVSYEKLV